MMTPQMQACSGCGKHYLQLEKRDRNHCPECRKRRLQEYRDLVVRRSFTLEIVHDPGPGGFSPGVRFEKQHVIAMLRGGAFSQGTQVRDLRGNQYQFNGQEFVSQETA